MTKRPGRLALPIALGAAVVFALGLAAWAQDQKAPSGAVEPDHITVQHVLIGFAGSVRGKNVTRSQEEAKALAYKVLQLAKGGARFDELVTQYTDDAPPGIYSMSNTGIAPAQGEYSRQGMVAAFGNVGFKLKVGEIGIADYDKTTSPFGWHIIKRIK